jgi:hypothetical protein
MRALGGVFRPKNDETSEQFRIMHNEEIRGLYRSPSIVKTVQRRKL